MTRRRRAPLVLGVCIGMFLLLFDTVAADTTKGIPLVPENPLEPDASAAEKSKLLLNKIPSKDEAGIISSERDKEAIGSYNSTVKDLDAVDREVTKNGKAEEEEKAATSIDKEKGIRSNNEVERLSSSDSANGSSRFEEIRYGTSGKSSSTKTVFDDSSRLSRTNDLTTVTTKPALEESRLDDKANKTSILQQFGDDAYQRANKSVKSLEDGIKPKEDRETDAQVKPRISSKEANLKLETVDSDRESTTHKALVLEEILEKTKKAEDFGPTKNSEVPDLRQADESEKSEEGISLINDTYVNYSHHYKTSTTKDSDVDSGSQPRVSENTTQFSLEGSTVTRISDDPKREVEVVGHVTHPMIQKVVEQPQNSTTKESVETIDESMQRSGKNVHSSDNFTKAAETDRKLEAKDLINEKNQQRSEQLTTERYHEETSTLQVVSSPIPRGRTIAFSGMNEYPSLETKPTVSSKIDVSFSKKNISADKALEQKPYPYVKSSVKEHNSSNQVEIATEEPSALENTIGRGQSEKLVVTEASDVLENSIQQFRPTYYEKPINESSTIASDTRSSVPMTTASLATLEEAKPTSQSANNESSVSKTAADAEEKSTNTGNDVPRWNEGREAITGKGNFDVTGNGITEVTLKPESVDKRTYEASLREIARRTTPSTMEFTVKPQTLSSSDVQTNVESSLLIRSTLNATELSTEYSLIKGNFSEGENSTIPVTSPADSSTVKTTEGASILSTTVAEEIPAENVTEASMLPDANRTNDIPSSASATFGPNEPLLPTTTSVEYEFVGLTEATTITEASEGRGSSNGIPTTVPSLLNLSTKNFQNESSTIAAATTIDNSLSTVATEATDDDRLSSIPVTDQTIVPTFVPSPTTQSKDDFATQSSVVEGKIEESSTREDDTQRTSSAAELWTTTSDEGIVTTVASEQLFSSGSKDPRFAFNVTEAATESTLISNIGATDDTRVTASFAPTSLRPEITVSSTTSAATVSRVPIEETDITKMSSPGEITSLVRIVMNGNAYDVCPKMEELKVTLAEILTLGLNRSVSYKQIIFQQDPCREPPSSTPTTSDMPLTSILIYVVDENWKFDSSMTNSLPTLYKESRDHVKFPVTIQSFLLVQETMTSGTGSDSGNAIAVVVVSSVAFICLVLLTGLLFIMRKRQTRFNYGERCRPVSLDAYSLDSVSAYNSVRRKGVARSSKRSYGNPTFEDSSAIPSHPLNFAGLSSFCNDINAINEEFSGIPQVSAKIDELPSGAEVKNRYANVIPLPETRVPLQKMNNDPLTEYINASYVRGPKNAMRYYIACQAPMESTVTDFWRMIWEQQCKVIIMLTDLVENGMEKCTEYIPPSEITDCHRLYGDFQVTLKKRETKEKYAISTLQLKNLENNTFREVYHIWYLWPVNGAQSDGAGLIAVLLEARALQRGGPGPIVVHCSPGTGRTGTLIALDLGIRQYEITRTVDVPRVVYTIRRDRAGAVQTKEQYAFIYKALNLYATKLAGGVLDST